MHVRPLETVINGPCPLELNISRSHHFGPSMFLFAGSASAGSAESKFIDKFRISLGRNALVHRCRSTMPSALLLASYAAFAGAAYLITLGIYRIFFSSISHIPGPKLAALTYYYQSWYDVYPHQGRFLWKCKELHGRHGPIVRIGPNEVHVHCPEIYVDMYGSHKNRRNKAASWFWMIGTGEFGDGSVFATLPDDLHRRRRSALSPYFSKQMVQKLEPRVHEKVLLLKDRILELAREGPVELTNAMSGLTLGRAVPLSLALVGPC